MKLYLLVLLISLQFTLVYSWGADGHQIVAQIASAFLTPTTWNSINPLLGGNTLANISTWPDAYDHSPEGSWSEKYHFVDLQTDALNFTYAACFPPEAPSAGCVVTAIQNMTAQLEYEFKHNESMVCNVNIPEPCPLSFLVHFLGDSHQPLHVAYDIDYGGNYFDVQYFSTCSNLHSVWDDGLIETYENNHDLEWYGLSQRLVQFLQARHEIYQDYLNHTDPAVWADETFSLARLVPYNLSPGSIAPSSIWFDEYTSLGAPVRNYPDVPPPKKLSCQYPGPIISQSYYTRTIPVVLEQLGKAGVRLAYQLNKIFDPLHDPMW